MSFAASNDFKVTIKCVVFRVSSVYLYVFLFDCLMLMFYKISNINSNSINSNLIIKTRSILGSVCWSLIKSLQRKSLRNHES